MKKIQEPAPAPPTHQEEARFAQQVLQAEAEAIQRVRLGREFHQAVDLIVAATQGPRPTARRTPVSTTDPTTPALTPTPPSTGTGSVVISGLGKSGLIGQKISATFASIGVHSHFLHPTEALHGDLGRIRRGDVVVLLSFGGNTEEVVTLATILRQDSVPVIAIVGKPGCALDRLAKVTLCIGDVTEACPMNMAPTASTTAMLALGDALALSVSRRGRLGVDEFRKNHPGGVLGKKLMPVVEAMRFRVADGLPTISVDLTVKQALRSGHDQAGGRRSGALLLVDDEGRLAGIFTDSDLRRLLVQRGREALDLPIREVMTAHPRRVDENSLVRDAVQVVREFRIDEVPVVDSEGRPLGLVDVQDLVALKVIEE